MASSCCNTKQCSEHIDNEQDDDNDFDAFDAGLAQCCIKDRENAKRHSEYMKKLRAVDPVARVERIGQQAVLGTNTIVSTKDWIHENCSCEQCLPQSENVQMDKSISSSDDDEDDDEFFDDEQLLAELCKARLQINSSNIQSCENVTDLCTLLNKTNMERFILCISSGTQDQAMMDRKVVENVEAWIQREGIRMQVLSHMAFCQIVGALITSSSNTSLRHLVANETLPCLVALDQSWQITGKIQNKQIQKSNDAISTWLSGISYDILNNLNKNDDSDQEETDNYCGRRGCDRRFPHEHVASKARYHANSDDE